MKVIGRAEAVERPGQPARPGGVVTPALVGGLAQELARLQVEDALVGGAAVAAHQIAARGQAVLVGDAPQILVAGLEGGVEDDAHVHHDVDEEALVGDEGAQVLALLLEAFGQRLAGLDHDVVGLLIFVDVIPTFPGRPEDEAQIVYAAVGLAMLDQTGVMLGPVQPIDIGGVLIEQPHLAAQKTFTPVGPGLAIVFPLAVLGVHGEVVRMGLDQVAHLHAGEVHGHFAFFDKAFSINHL